MVGNLQQIFISMGGCIVTQKRKKKGAQENGKISQPSNESFKAKGVKIQANRLILELPSQDKSETKAQMSRKVKKKSENLFSFHLGDISVENEFIQLQIFNYQSITVFWVVGGKYFYDYYRRLSRIVDCDLVSSKTLPKKSFLQREKSSKISFKAPQKSKRGPITVILDAYLPNQECLYLRYTYEQQNGQLFKLIQPVMMQWDDSTYELK